MKRWKYVGSDPCQLVDGEFVVTLVPDQEFDAPESFVPEPNPHPSFQPVLLVSPKPAPSAPQE